MAGTGGGGSVPDGRRRLGIDGEDLVTRWYEARGYEVLDRNWRCREGELDLVVALGPVVAFCEVKTRSGYAFGAPVEAVTPRKTQRLRTLAALWLRERRPGYAEVRFDVAGVLWRRGEEPEIEVLEGVF